MVVRNVWAVSLGALCIVATVLLLAPSLSVRAEPNAPQVGGTFR
ncbi:MAG: hypothetical protein ABI874_08255 [Chloroflexota bacterium]